MKARSYLAATLSLSLSASLIACSNASEAKTVTMLVYDSFPVKDTPLQDALADFTTDTGIKVRLLQADLEGAAWPYAGSLFAGIVVTNYLHRPLLPILVESLAPGGILIYETFALGNERFGKPSKPAFLLKPGDLLEAVRGKLRVLGYEDGYQEVPKPAMVQRICALRHP